MENKFNVVYLQSVYLIELATKLKIMIKRFIEKLKALRIYAVGKSFFCRHKWDDFKIRNFDETKMDDKGRLTTKMLIRICSKCGKTEHFAIN